MNLMIPLQRLKTPPKIGHPSNEVEYLAYKAKTISNTQARLLNRIALVPDIELSRFSTRAVIDFIVLRFVLGRNSQFQHIQDLVESVLGRVCYVVALFAGAGNSASEFEVKIHDPTMTELIDVCQAVINRYGLEALPFIATLEVSVDFCPRQPDRLERAKLLKTLTNSFMPTRDVFANPADRPRFTFGKAKDETKFLTFWAPHLTAEQARHVEMSTDADTTAGVDATFYAGKLFSKCAWRIMDKILDQQNHAAGTRTELREHERRVRIEVTLQCPELDRIGLNYLHDLGTLSFTSLQRRYFRFWLPTFHRPSKSPAEIRRTWQDGMRRDKFGKTGVIGLMRMDQAWDQHHQEQRRRSAPEMHRIGLRLPKARRTGIGQAGTLVAYDEMNGAVSSALERLGQRVASDFRRG